MMMMKLDDRDIVCEQDYTPLSNAELVEAIELHVAIMYTSPIIDFDLEWIIGPARALLARAEAAEAEARRLKEAGRMVKEEVVAWRDSYESLNEQRLALAARVAELEAALGGLDALAPDYELPDGAAVAMAIGNGQILTAGRHAIHSAVMSVIDSNRDNEALRARVAELEAQLAAQGWRPVTEEWPPYGVQHLGRGLLNSPTLLITRTVNEGNEVWQDSDGMLFYAREIRYCAAIPEARPLPPAPQEPTQ